MAKNSNNLIVETLTHDEATRKNIPTAEYQSVMAKDEQSPIRLAYERRNRDLDPQLVWHGKDEQDWSDLVVHAPPLYIQEKVHPKVLIDDLLRRSKEAPSPQGGEGWGEGAQIDLFSDFNGLPNDNAKTEFYRHDAHWTNRMILGDSLQVMTSLAEREGLRGKVQCIYFDPPYGIKFNSNFQWSTTSRDVKDGNADHITREPEQVKAFRDTWRDGIHSYLTYLRDRLTVARDLLSDSGSIFVQIGDENVHRVRAVMDEVFGEKNFLSQISFKKTGGENSGFLGTTVDYILWFAKRRDNAKFRSALVEKLPGQEGAIEYLNVELIDGTIRKLTPEEMSNPNALPKLARVFATWPIVSPGYSEENSKPIKVKHHDKLITLKCPGNRHWSVGVEGTKKLWKYGRLLPKEGNRIYKRYLDDFNYTPLSNTWMDSRGELGMTYVVQTSSRIIQRCILMASDPGDLVLDPTCGSGTTAYVSEQWGRRWITIDTSRVALALTRARIMGARYPYYLLVDSRDGQLKEAEINRTTPSSQQTQENIKHGFVYERVRHITQSIIANNNELDIIWDKFQEKLETLREQLNQALGKQWQEWEIPRGADANWSDAAKKFHADWWQQRIARQQEIDASIAAKADFEYLYDKPYEDKKKVRVAGPFTVESLSPHRVLIVDENDELVDGVAESYAEYREERDFVQMILENLKTAGVQQAHKQDKIVFTALSPWPGELICAEGRYSSDGDGAGRGDGTGYGRGHAGGAGEADGTGYGESFVEKRAAIFIGPEFGTVSRPDLVAAAREAGDAGFDVLIACAFNYDAHSSEFDKLGRIPVLKARMNADLHMADDLKNTGKGNLFVIFGEPDIDILDAEDSKIQVKVNGVDVFHPNTGEVRSDGAEGIACWFIDTDYNEESFFVRHAYFLGANDPYKALKTTLKAEINEEAWATLNSDTSRPFDKPKSGRIAVKVINHLGDEVMKVFKIL
jgi:adenine-specific DNA-methyltransferase